MAGGAPVAEYRRFNARCRAEVHRLALSTGSNVGCTHASASSLNSPESLQHETLRGQAARKVPGQALFTKTPEPAPAVPDGPSGPLLFIVQKHAARRLHYDFRLELDGVLKSWAVPKGPSLQPGERRLAVEVEDHPFDYASFEGVIPEKNYGAGNVIVWDCGVYSPDEGSEYSFDDRAEAEERLRREYKQGKLSFFLRGIKLKGSFALVRTSTDKQWLLIKHKDRFIGGDDLLAHNTSVLTGDTLDDVAESTNRERLAGDGAGARRPLRKNAQRDRAHARRARRQSGLR